EAIPVYLLLSNRVNSLRLIPLVSSLIDIYWLLVCDRPVIDYISISNLYLICLRLFALTWVLLLQGQ
ncbi:hypothetical protein LC608_36410, partial [Nostoc sp. XA010]|uniref:hypothetical protein n=1 Tax=Nostoc sp. XA010 TaxID=2780407 RepID=UPI001E356B14